MKMLEKYQFLSTDWLLFGKGSMYKDNKMQTLFDQSSDLIIETDKNLLQKDALESEMEFQKVRKEEIVMDLAATDEKKTLVVEKIVWFYSNKSFEEYFPHQ